MSDAVARVVERFPARDSDARRIAESDATPAAKLAQLRELYSQSAHAQHAQETT